MPNDPASMADAQPARPSQNVLTLPHSLTQTMLATARYTTTTSPAKRPMPAPTAEARGDTIPRRKIPRRGLLRAVATTPRETRPGRWEAAKATAIETIESASEIARVHVTVYCKKRAMNEIYILGGEPMRVRIKSRERDLGGRRGKRECIG